VARTFTVYEVPGTRLCAVKVSEVDSPSSTLFVPICRNTSYRVTLPPVEGVHEMVVVCAVVSQTALGS
jgi:hypothetical protein